MVNKQSIIKRIGLINSGWKKIMMKSNEFFRKKNQKGTLWITCVITQCVDDDDTDRFKNSMRMYRSYRIG